MTTNSPNARSAADVAAPIAAWLVRTIPPRILGSLVGGLIVLTNSKTIMGKGGLALDDAAKWVVYGLVWAVWIAAVAYSMRAHRAEVAAEATATRDSDESTVDLLSICLICSQIAVWCRVETSHSIARNVRQPTHV
mgnify:CR=1 FL=1